MNATMSTTSETAAKGKDSGDGIVVVAHNNIGGNSGVNASKNTNTKPNLKHSASSLVLELLDSTAKRRASELEHNNNTNLNMNTSTSGGNAAAAASSATTVKNELNTSAAPSQAHKQQPSVVPRLMDIYSDMAQSSTPQITTGAATTTNNIPKSAVSNNISATSSLSKVSSNNQPSQLNNTQLSGTNHAIGGQLKSGSSSIANARVNNQSVLPMAPPSSSTAKHPLGSNGSSAPNARKKAKTTDKRWSKRFIWPDDLHREFVSAIFEVGLKQGSPSAIIEYMKPNPDITSERLKSHLQKYRQKKQQSYKEFITSYDSAVKRFREEQPEDNGEDVLENLTCGEKAAFYTVSASLDSSREASRRPTPVQSSDIPAFHMPSLTMEEYHGPIGQSFRYIASLHRAMTEQLEISRRYQQSYQSAPQFQRSQQQGVLENAAATAASIQTNPSMHEVAASVPHYLPEQLQQPQAQYAHNTSTAQQPVALPNNEQQQSFFQHHNHAIPTISPRHHQQGTSAFRPPGSNAQQQAPTTTTSQATSTANNIKESSLMKQEMKGQMTIQNKFRMLKQKELDKYGGAEQRSHTPLMGPVAAKHPHTPGNSGNGNDEQFHQMLEAADLDNVIWNADDDAQIFDFLME